MLKRAIAFGLLLLGLCLGLIAACSSLPNENKTPSVETVVLKGTSTGGGNAITVIVSFGSFLRTSGVSWSKLGLDIARLEVPKAPGCATYETLTPESGALHLDLLKSGALRLKFYLPEGTKACAVGIVPAGTTPFVAQGTLDDGRLLTIKSQPGTLYLLPKSGVFNFAPNATENWVTGLDLQAWLPQTLLAQIANPSPLRRFLAASSEILVDAEHNSGYLAALNDNLAQSLLLAKDLHQNGALSDTEWQDDTNTLGAGSTEAPDARCDTNTDCATGQICVNGACQLAGDTCTTDSDCPTNQVCDTTTHRCATPNSACANDSSCATGQICVNGVCQVAEDGDTSEANACQSNADCPTGQVCLANVCSVQ